MDYTVVFTIIGAIWAIVTFIIGYRDNALKQQIEHIKLIREYNKDLRGWADNAINLMTSAAMMCLLDPQKDGEFYFKRHNLLISLSAEIDKGRFFLPNTGIDQHGHHKPSAYRGFKSDALNALTSCYNYVEKMDYNDKKINKPYRDEIVKAKRIFVSEVQAQLDPKKFEIIVFNELKKHI